MDRHVPVRPATGPVRVLLGSKLLCQWELLGVGEVGFEQREELAGEVALEAAHDLLGGLAPGGAALGVGAGGGVDPQACQGDGP
jgi:hypothetical protein